MTIRPTLAFLALCLLTSTAWLTVTLLPSTLSPTSGQGIRLLALGVGALLVFCTKGSLSSRPSAGRCAAVSFACLGLIGIPFLLLEAAQGKVASACGVLMFACMPISLAVIGASSSADSGLRPLPYGLMGVAGILILLPISVPQGLAGILGSGALLLAMVSTALSILWLHRLLDRFPILLAIALAGCLNGGLLVAVAGVSPARHWDLHAFVVEIVRCLLLDLPELILLVWLVKGFPPQRLSAQYLATPLMTILEVWFVFRPALDSRTILGIALLGAGAYFSFKMGKAEPEPTLTIRCETVSDDRHHSGGDGRS